MGKKTFKAANQKKQDNNMKHIALTLAAILLGAAQGMMAGSIYVSAKRGSDAAAGTRQQPLQTLAQAMKQAREWRRLGDPRTRGGISILLEQGVYRQLKPLFIRPEDSGTALSPTVIRGMGEPGGAVVSGGTEVKGWAKGATDPRIAPALRRHIWTAPVPMHNGRPVETRQLWLDGQKMQRAAMLPDGQMQRMKAFSPETQTITIPTPPANMIGTRGAEMMVHQRWAIAILRIRQMRDNRDGTTTVWFHEPESQLEFAHPWPQPVIDGERGSSSYNLVGSLEMLDQPGEWYQDQPSGQIYIYPPAGISDMTQASAVVPVMDNIITIEGCEERQVSNLRFENISIEHAAWLRPSLEGHVTLQGGFRLIDAYKLPVPGLPHNAALENQAWIARPEAAVTVRHARNIAFEGCRLKHLAATGIDYETAVTASSIEGCTLTDIGGTAIQAGGFGEGGFETHIPYQPSRPGTLCDSLIVRGNEIYDATNEDWGCVGIGAGYVRNMTIDNNHVHHLNYSGICVGWGWTALESGMRNNSITNNRVHHFAQQLYDAGGIYTLSNQPGSLIRGNIITHIGQAPYATNHRAFYIYFDEATDGFTVENNICPEVKFGYNKPGKSMVIRGNGPVG